MKHPILIGLGTLLSIALAASPAHARYDEHDAQRDCEGKVLHDDRYKGLRNVKVSDQGHHSYNVTGKVRMDGNDHHFFCRIRHREIVSWHVEGSYSNGKYGNSGGGDGNSAAMAGAGVLAVMAIAALAASSSNDDDDRDHNESRNRYQSGDDDAFSDMRYLKKECKHEVRRHLHQDHGRVERLRFNHVHLDGHRLRGDGEVGFEHGRDRSLSFTCEFDRRGRIHDGDYHYY